VMTSRALYDRKTKNRKTAAVPEFGHLTDPVYSPDGQRVLYSLADAVNGAYNGNGGLGQAVLSTGTQEGLYPPTRDD